MLNVVGMPSCSFMDYNTYITWKHLEKNFGPTFQVRPKICIWPPDYRVCILVQVTIYRRLLIGQDGHLDQSEAYDIS